MFSYAETTTYGYNRVHENRLFEAFFSSTCHGMVESPAPAVPFLFIQLPRQPCEFISDRSWLFGEFVCILCNRPRFLEDASCNRPIHGMRTERRNDQDHG